MQSLTFIIFIVSEKTTTLQLLPHTDNRPAARPPAYHWSLYRLTFFMRVRKGAKSTRASVPIRIPISGRVLAKWFHSYVPSDETRKKNTQPCSGNMWPSLLITWQAMLQCDQAINLVKSIVQPQLCFYSFTDGFKSPKNSFRIVGNNHDDNGYFQTSIPKSSKRFTKNKQHEGGGGVEE